MRSVAAGAPGATGVPIGSAPAGTGLIGSPAAFTRLAGLLVDTEGGSNIGWPQASQAPDERAAATSVPFKYDRTIERVSFPRRRHSTKGRFACDRREPAPADWPGAPVAAETTSLSAVPFIAFAAISGAVSSFSIGLS